MVLQGSRYQFLIGLVCVLLTAFALFFLMLPNGSLDLRPVNKATILDVDKSIDLPYFEVRKSRDDLLEFGYSIQLTGEIDELLKSDSTALTKKPAHGLLFMQILNGGDFYLNDVWVAGLPKSTNTNRWQWYRPMLIPLPPSLLNTDGQPNIIKVLQSTHEPYVVISRPYVGSMFDLSLVYEVAIFLSSTLANASNLFCLIVGLFMMCAWVLSPKGNIFGLAGGAAVLWAVLFTLALWVYMPLSVYKLWRLSIYLATGGLIVIMSMFILNFIGEPLSKFFVKIFIGFASVAPIIYSIAGRSSENALDRMWTAPMILVFVYACARLAVYCIRVRSALAMALLVQSIFCVILAFHDYGVLTGALLNLFSVSPVWGWSSLFFEPIYLCHLVMPFLLLIMGYIFLGQYGSYVASVENSNINLVKSLKHLEVELGLSHEDQKKMERIDATRIERERIYQDVHDGIGSRLVTAVFSIRKGNIKPSEIEVQLLDCLTDLRMVINSENDQNIDIQTAIFEYCSNQESLLKSDSLLLSYDISNGPGVYLPLASHLNVIRILQEAITNIIKHANASEVWVKVEQNDVDMNLYISDNGQGLSASSGNGAGSEFGLSGGNGLTGMAARAKAIGGDFSLDRLESWTIVRLRIPLLVTYSN